MESIWNQAGVDVTAGWRKVRSEEFHTLYFSPNIINMIKIEEDAVNRTCSTRCTGEKYSRTPL